MKLEDKMCLCAHGYCTNYARTSSRISQHNRRYVPETCIEEAYRL